MAQSDKKNLNTIFKKQSGFTLIELVVVIALIAIMAAIAVPNFLNWLPNMRLKAAARDVYSNLQKARMMAVKENKSIRVRFNNSTSPGSYYFDTDNDGAYSPGEYIVKFSQLKDVDFGNGKAEKDWNNNDISQASVITFSPSGTANSASVYLTNIKNKDICYAIISTTSGFIKLRKYNGIHGWE